MLGRNVFVAHALGDFLRPLYRLRTRIGHVRLGVGTGNFREGVERAPYAEFERRTLVGTHFGKQGADDSALLRDKACEQVYLLDFGIAPAPGYFARAVDGLYAFFCKFFGIDTHMPPV